MTRLTIEQSLLLEPKQNQTGISERGIGEREGLDDSGAKTHVHVNCESVHPYLHVTADGAEPLDVVPIQRPVDEASNVRGETLPFRVIPLCNGNPSRAGTPSSFAAR